MKTIDHQPWLLHDNQSVWFVDKGEVDLFLVPEEAGTPSIDGADLADNLGAGGRWHHLRRIGTDEAIWGVPKVRGGALVCRPLPGAIVRQTQRDSLLRAMVESSKGADDESHGLEKWLIELSAAVMVFHAPRSWIRLQVDEAEAVLDVDQGSYVVPHGFLWVRHVTGASKWCGRADHPVKAQDSLVALTDRSWLTITEKSRLEAVSTAGLLASCSLSQIQHAIDATHDMLLRAIIEDTQVAENMTQKRLKARQRLDQAMMEDALHRLAASVPSTDIDQLGTSSMGAMDDPLFAACRLVGRAAGIDIQAPTSLIEGRASRDPIFEIAFASKVQVRPVRLRGQWFHQDNGPLVGFIEKDDALHPVALILKSPWHYEAIDPATRDKWRITKEKAKELFPQAFMFYRSLPMRKISALDLIKFGFQNIWKRDLLVVIAMGMAAGALGMLLPIVTGDLFDRVIPQTQTSQIWPLALLLAAGAFGTLLFEFTRNIALIRIEGRLETAMQSAIWDRVVHLPTTFFRKFAAGDLAVRAMGINAVRQAISGVAVMTILTSVFSVFNFGLLFYYDRNLAWIATVILAVSLALTMILGLIGIKYQRALATTQGKIAALVFQMINGINKFRMAGAEERAFFLWAERFSEQRKVAYKAGAVESVHRTIQAVLPVVTNLVLFSAFVVRSDHVGLSPGRFLAFMAAFGAVNAALIAMSHTFLTLLNVVPYFERAKPILNNVPEVDPAREDPGPLSGEIELSHVSFRYDESGPWIIDGASFYVRPGQFVAIVGPSGQGKSTLLRLLLGFEKPASGAIYFDGKDLATLDLRAIRRQIGVVLQDGVLTQGDIYTNITGTANISIEEAWDAARMAGIAGDIEQMPMGMHTMIPDGGGTLSGGQRQRLLIARALVRKPRILLFDEATSALDNETQATVMQSLAELRATRIVIAHRLSTVIHADRIFVINHGRIVQQGSYDELMAQEGLFVELAQRQLA